MDFENLTRTYIRERFSSASQYEKEKLYKDWQGKEKSAYQVVVDFEKRVGKVKGKKVLEIGFGNGYLTVAFAKAGADVYGLEIDPILFEIGRVVSSSSGVVSDLRLYDGAKFPFRNDFFDYAYSTSVLEHVADKEAFIKEAYRVLKPGGNLYLSFPNRWWLKETHLGLWFVSYLPEAIANRFSLFFGRSPLRDYGLHFISYWTLKKLLRHTSIKFEILYEVNGNTMLKRALKQTLAFFGIHHSAILRTVMVVLRK